MEIHLHFVSLVPVDIWTSTALPPPMITDESDSGSESGEADGQESTEMTIGRQGCDIGGEMYMDGMQVNNMNYIKEKYIFFVMIEFLNVLRACAIRKLYVNHQHRPPYRSPTTRATPASCATASGTTRPA